MDVTRRLRPGPVSVTLIVILSAATREHIPLMDLYTSDLGSPGIWQAEGGEEMPGRASSPHT